MEIKGKHKNKEDTSQRDMSVDQPEGKLQLGLTLKQKTREQQDEAEQ